MTDSTQSRLQFRALVNDICRKLNYPDCAELIDDDGLVMEMQANNVDFMISHTKSDHPEKIIIESVFGSLPQENTELILMKLLEWNANPAETGQFALERTDDASRVIYSHSCNLEDKSSGSILNIMAEMAWLATHWKETNFLKESLVSASFDTRILASLA
jgi:hypothetical protein